MLKVVNKRTLGVLLYEIRHVYNKESQNRTRLRGLPNGVRVSLLKITGPVYLLGSFSRGDGSENVTIKMNSRFFKRRRDYSNSL